MEVIKREINENIVKTLTNHIQYRGKVWTWNATQITEDIYELVLKGFPCENYDWNPD